MVGERLDLQAWAALVVEGTTRHGSSSRKSSARHNDKLEQKRGELLKVLLEVYMSGGYVLLGVYCGCWIAQRRLGKQRQAIRRVYLILKGENWTCWPYVFCD